ncbi:hypothetical protein [Variovorax sp. PAMC26660]|uniref:hypothetical protein n=1 Tax=Variovorax sp. PAMC26660 TaxID=2762322 RepID=UPI00164D3512|nr:hypothetical protein [Variovorax sp. PAMC26660]QNK69528.1 hypothetical protein H7F35_07480 [Variovorax sp. PAMC26660]
MSGNDTLTNFDGDDALRDPALRRALDHAPDSEATPDPRTRDAIRKMAHNLAATPVSATASAANSASDAPWWRRLLGGGKPRSRMPWNAAFATVLVATFVTVLWHREPIPDAQLDGEARVAGATAPAQAPAPIQPPAEITSQASQPAAAAAPEPTPPAVAAQQAPASPAAAPRDSRAKESANASTADEVRRPAAAQPYAKQAPRAPESDQKKSVEASAPAPAQAAPAPIAPSPPPAIAAEQSAPARDEQREKQLDGERRRAYSAAPSAASVALPPTVDLERSPSSPPAPAAAPRPAITRKETQGNNTSSFAGQANADAQATGALRQAAPSAAAKAAKPSGAASFAALDQWTSFDFARSGLGVRNARGDIEGLAALVNTVARSATSVDQPLVAPVEVRLALYRGDALIAVLEIAGDQVRWTPQPDGIATVGMPPAQALVALRALLTR